MKQLKKLQTLIALTLILTLSIPSLVQAKSGEEIQAFKKFLQKERQKYCFGNRLDDGEDCELKVWYSFADIDGDGRKELIISEINSVRHSFCYIYRYHNKKVEKFGVYSSDKSSDKSLYNKKYNCTEDFDTVNGGYKKVYRIEGLPIYRVSGKKDLIFVAFMPGCGISKRYVYYHNKTGQLHQKYDSSLNTWGKQEKYGMVKEGWWDWKIQDSYLYKNHNLKGKLIKIKYSEEKHLISVLRDFETGNIIVNTDSY